MGKIWSWINRIGDIILALFAMLMIISGEAKFEDYFLLVGLIAFPVLRRIISKQNQH